MYRRWQRTESKVRFATSMLSVSLNQRNAIHWIYYYHMNLTMIYFLPTKFAKHTLSALLSCKLKMYIEYLYKPSFYVHVHIWNEPSSRLVANAIHFLVVVLLQKVRKEIIELLLFELTNWIKSLELQSDHITNDVRTAHLNNSIW